MSSSDDDSEQDRRAYGQFPSLSVEGNSDVDEEAVAYLMAVRSEAAGLPDVMFAESCQPHANQGGKDGQQEEGRSSMYETAWPWPASEIKASDDWVHSFLSHFRSLRHDLQRLQLGKSGGADEAASVVEQESDSDVPPGLASLQKMPQDNVIRLLESTVDEVVQRSLVQTLDVYTLYSLSAVLEYPLHADTDACMARLLRHCNTLRSCQDHTLQALLDILVVIAGVYFGQDLSLKHEYRTADIVL